MAERIGVYIDAASLPPGTDADVVAATALAVLDQFELDRPVRLLGVRLELEMPVS